VPRTAEDLSFARFGLTIDGTLYTIDSLADWMMQWDLVDLKGKDYDAWMARNDAGVPLAVMPHDIFMHYPLPLPLGGDHYDYQAGVWMKYGIGEGVSSLAPHAPASCLGACTAAVAAELCVPVSEFNTTWAHQLGYPVVAGTKQLNAYGDCTGIAEVVQPLPTDMSLPGSTCSDAQIIPGRSTALLADCTGIDSGSEREGTTHVIPDLDAGYIKVSWKPPVSYECGTDPATGAPKCQPCGEMSWTGDGMCRPLTRTDPTWAQCSRTCCPSDWDAC
jgi:hypothetical protein